MLERKLLLSFSINRGRCQQGQSLSSHVVFLLPYSGSFLCSSPALSEESACSSLVLPRSWLDGF